MAEKITINDDHTLNVSDNPIIPFIEGDGTGIDIWPAAKLVLDAAAGKYGRTIEWIEVLAGEKAFNETGDWLPQQTVDTFEEYLIGIKGPLTTPIGGGFRSLNVALRQLLDLYVCLRPVRWFEGVPSPVKQPELVDMVIFRENTEDIYAGIEAEAGSPEAETIPAEHTETPSDPVASEEEEVKAEKPKKKTRTKVKKAEKEAESSAEEKQGDSVEEETESS